MFTYQGFYDKLSTTSSDSSTQATDIDEGGYTFHQSVYYFSSANSSHTFYESSLTLAVTSNFAPPQYTITSSVSFRSERGKDTSSQFFSNSYTSSDNGGSISSSSTFSASSSDTLTSISLSTATSSTITTTLRTYLNTETENIHTTAVTSSTRTFIPSTGGVTSTSKATTTHSVTINWTLTSDDVLSATINTTTSSTRILTIGRNHFNLMWDSDTYTITRFGTNEWVWKPTNLMSFQNISDNCDSFDDPETSDPLPIIVEAFSFRDYHTRLIAPGFTFTFTSNTWGLSDADTVTFFNIGNHFPFDDSSSATSPRATSSSTTGTFTVSSASYTTVLTSDSVFPTTLSYFFQTFKTSISYYKTFIKNAITGPFVTNKKYYSLDKFTTSVTTISTYTMPRELADFAFSDFVTKSAQNFNYTFPNTSTTTVILSSIFNSGDIFSYIYPKLKSGLQSAKGMNISNNIYSKISVSLLLEFPYFLQSESTNGHTYFQSIGVLTDSSVPLTANQFGTASTSFNHFSLAHIDRSTFDGLTDVAFIDDTVYAFVDFYKPGMSCTFFRRGITELPMPTTGIFGGQTNLPYTIEISASSNSVTVNRTFYILAKFTDTAHPSYKGSSFVVYFDSLGSTSNTFTYALEGIITDSTGYAVWNLVKNSFVGGLPLKSDELATLCLETVYPALSYNNGVAGSSVFTQGTTQIPNSPLAFVALPVVSNGSWQIVGLDSWGVLRYITTDKYYETYVITPEGTQ